MRTKDPVIRFALVALVPVMLLLTACPGPSATEPPDFGLSASNVSVAAGASATSTVTIARTNFDGAVALSVSGAPAGVSAALSEASTSGDSVDVDVDVDIGVAPHSAALTVTGTAGGMTRSAELALEVTGSSVTIDTVAIEGYGGSTQARQGRSIDVEITGVGLAGIGLAKLGDISGYVDANNNLSASIGFYVPHGEPLGPKDLVVIADAGEATVAGAVTVTAITAGPDGNDDDGEGTPDLPYRTLSYANQVADSGDTVLLLDGTYDEAAGEAFPIEVESGVILSGESEAGSVVQGNGADDCLVFTGGSASSLTLDGCDSGVHVASGSVAIDGVTTTDNVQEGILVGSAANAVTITATTSSGNAGRGLLLYSSGETLVEGSTFAGNSGQGIYKHSGSGTVTVTNSVVTGNGNLSGVTGILVTAPNATIVLDGLTVTQNGSRGVHVSADGVDLSLRSSTVTGNATYGVAIEDHPAAVDLGTAAAPGDNVIEDNGDGTHAQLYDDRPAGQTAVVTAHGVDLGGVGVPPTGIQTGADSDLPRWEITGAGNQIDFGP